MFPAGHKCGAGLNARSITGGIDAEWSVGTEQFDDTTDGCDGIRQRVVSKTLTAPWRLDRCADTALHVTITSNLEGVLCAHATP
jgi:hypothetical protein